MIYEQIELLDPLGTSLRKPAAQRLAGKGALIFSEILCYLLAAGIITFMFFMHKIYPFYLLADLRFKPEYRNMGWLNIQALNLVVYAIVALVAIMFYGFARASRWFRLKNDVLHLAGTNLKEIVGQHLKRKASIDAIEQRHFLELPNTHLEEGVNVNEVPNPGFEE